MKEKFKKLKVNQAQIILLRKQIMAFEKMNIMLLHEITSKIGADWAECEGMANALKADTNLLAVDITAKGMYEAFESVDLEE